MIEWITCTVSANEPTYRFEISLSDLDLERLKYRRLFGLFNIQKSKWEFLNDLRDVLTEEIVKHFEKMLEDKSKAAEI